MKRTESFEGNSREPNGGKPIGFPLISKDISDEIRLTQYARSLIEAGVDPLVTISPERKITDVNDARAKVTGVLVSNSRNKRTSFEARSWESAATSSSR